MSHIALVKVEIRSLGALQVACERLGLQLRRGQKTHRWYGRWMNDDRGERAAVDNGIPPQTLGTCAHAIAIPDDGQAYEIGVVRNPAGGGYVLGYDFWGPQGRKLEALAGPACRRLTQEYAAAAAEQELDELVSQGWQLTRTRQDNGDIVLHLTA